MTCSKRFEYTVKPGLNPPHYCGDACKPQITGMCHKCGDACSGALCRACYRNRHAAPIRNCEICGNEFRRLQRQNDSARTCSRECGFVLYAREKAANARATQADNERASKLAGSLKPCRNCGIYIAGIRLTCSDECQRLDAIAQRTGREFSCLDCGATVAPVQRRKNLCLPKRCTRCESARRRAQRRLAKMRLTESTDLLKRLGRTSEVATRLAAIVRAENGICPLCGLLLSEDCDPNHDRHLEFDHKLPRSKGGRDDYSNLRAICRRCNGLKRDFTAPELVLNEHISNSL